MWQLCPVCKNQRERQHFRGETYECIFCEIDAAFKHADKLQTYLNNHAPTGMNLRVSCYSCKNPQWWNAVKERNGHMYCVPCLERKAEEDRETAKARSEYKIAASNAEIDALFG